jgi:Shedu protein SduA, C-terminal
MKLITETKKLLLFKEKSGSITKYFRQHKENDSEPVLIYEYSSSKFIFPFEGEVIKSVVLDGYKKLPPFMNNYGYGFENYVISKFFRYQFKDNRFNKLTISATKKSKKYYKTLIIDEVDLEDLTTSLNQEQYACNQTKKILIKNLLVSIFPDFAFDHRETNSNKKLIMRNFNDKFLSQLIAEDVDIIGDFYIKAALKYKRPDLVKKMNLKLSKASQLLTLNEVISKFEKLIADNPAESKWQLFFDEYITLFDSRYAHRLKYKNIATGLTKYPDLVLVDIYGYVDFYELKKSGAELIKYDKNHKTWFWTEEIAKVIAQCSDYLQKAKDNAVSYTNQIKIETSTENNDGIVANIVNPRAIIVIGTSSKLNTQKKKINFKALRESLKDIEFLLYDELLERLKNLMSKLQYDE